jgi:type I restriction enzyme R subunit
LIDNKQLILSRSYQYHAVKNCFKQILQTNESGYIFHATGSGKTLTSFLLSRDLSRESKIDKVLFVIDRNDLGEQTQEEFKKYTAFGTKLETKYDVENTNDLIKKLQNKNEKLIITSIQKLNNACSKARKQEIIESIKNKKIVFIYDECHRSQAGDMRKNIDDIFNKPQAIGFTGTPIYETSQTSSEIRTVDIFGDCLHTYSFNDAVSDSNVVPYDIDFPVNLKYTKDAEKKFVETVD